MRKYTTKQQSIINELHNKDYFYTRYEIVKENTRKKYKVTNNYMDLLISRELENIKAHANVESLVYIKNFG